MPAAMAREGQAIQYFAAELVRFEGTERPERVPWQPKLMS